MPVADTIRTFPHSKLDHHLPTPISKLLSPLPLTLNPQRSTYLRPIDMTALFVLSCIHENYYPH